jgi:hypothetical protein
MRDRRLDILHAAGVDDSVGAVAISYIDGRRASLDVAAFDASVASLEAAGQSLFFLFNRVFGETAWQAAMILHGRGKLWAPAPKLPAPAGVPSWA